MDLYRFKGIDDKGSIKRGTVKAKDKVSALRIIKTERNIRAIIDIERQSEIPFIRKTREALEKQIEEAENKQRERSMQKRKEKEKKKKQKKKKTKKKKEKKSFKDMLETNISFSLRNAKKRNSKYKKEVDKESYDELIRLFNSQFVEDELSNNNLYNSNYEDESDKPKLREKKMEKKQRRGEQSLNWGLIENNTDDPLLKKHMKIKIKDRDVLMFTKRLQIMLSSGMSLTHSLSVLSKTKSSKMNYVVKNILIDIQSGMPLSNALARFPRQFNYFYIALVSIGESAGTLQDVLLDIVESKEQQGKVSKKMKTASIYPSLIGIVLVSVLVLGSIFFVPRFEEMFLEQGMDLPLITRFIFSTARKMPLITVSAIIFLASFSILKRRSKRIARFHKKNKDKFILSCPFFNKVFKANYMYNFSFTIALMLKNGIRLKDSLLLAQKTIDNIYIKSQVSDISDLIVQGASFSEAIAKQEDFDEIIENIVLTGEESGQLSSTLTHISKFYSEEVSKYVDRLSELIQPVSILLVALFVVPVIFAIYLPILELSSGALLDL